MCDWPSASDPWASHAHRCEEDRGGAQPQEPGGGTVGRPERLQMEMEIDEWDWWDWWDSWDSPLSGWIPRGYGTVWDDLWGINMI